MGGIAPPPDPSAHSPRLPDTLIDFTADTTRPIAQLLYGNTFARTPDVKYIFSHAGGTAPYLAKRFGARASAAETFRHLYWDTAASWSDPVLHLLRDVVGLGRVLFGSDFPYVRRDIAIRGREDIEASPELTDSERTAILGATAMTLIPRLARMPALNSNFIPNERWFLSPVNTAAGACSASLLAPHLHDGEPAPPRPARSRTGDRSSADSSQPGPFGIKPDSSGAAGNSFGLSSRRLGYGTRAADAGRAAARASAR